MRNLKKILALVLALMMTLSLMVTASADFNDQDDIKYTEAVDVMTAIGVLQGGDGGNFYPNVNLDRAAAAKIIAYMLLTPDVAEKLGTPTAPFNDVPANAWYAGSVAYCASRGIISGAGDGNFYPSLALDGYSFGKMLLLAAGIGESSDYEGANWQVNVATAVVQNELDKGISGLILSNTLNRETAAQLAFNTLNKGEDVTITETKYVVASTTTKDGNGKTFADYADDVNGSDHATYNLALAAGTAVVMSDTVGDTTPTATYGVNFTISPMTVTRTIPEGSIAQTVYNLDFSTAGSDAFGNPSKVWYLDGTPVVKLDSEPVLTLTSVFTGGMLYTALGRRPGSPAVAVTYIEDGKANSTTASAISTAIVSGDNTPFGGTGALTKVYRTGNNSITITVMNTYVGRITAWAPADINDDGQVRSGEEITLGALGTDPGLSGTPSPDGVYNTFETTDFTKDDAHATNGTVVLYTIAYNRNSNSSAYQKYVIQSVVPAQPVTATASRLNSNGTFVADGTTYSYSAKTASGQRFTATTLNGQPAVLYLDTYGNVIAVTGVATAAVNYAVIIGLAPVAGGGQGTLQVAGAQQAMLLLTDGTTTTVTIVPNKTGTKDKMGDVVNVGYMDYVAAQNKGDGSDDDNAKEKTAVVPAEHDVVTYTVNAKGEYVVTLKSNEEAQPTSNTITTNTPLIDGTNVANDKTIFLVKTGGTAAQPVFTAYTGIGSVPSFNGTNANSNAGTRIFVDNGIVKLVYLNVASPVNAGTSSTDLVFIAGPASTATATVTLDAQNNQVFTFTQKAVINGEIVDVQVSGSNTTTSVVADPVLSGSVTRNSDGVITAAPTLGTTLVNGTGLLDVNKVQTAGADGVIKLQKDSTAGTNYLYNSQTVVYEVNLTTGAITVKSIANLQNGTDIAAAYVVNNVLTAIYYTVTP